MILTPSRLEELGQELWGEPWPDILADRLQRSKRTILRWSRGQIAIPTGLVDRLVEVIDDQMATCAVVRERLTDG